ncbi:DUF4190 domain-containing protein [Nesterenkonia lacusekhoensis]|uniref:DUF4190 domain-containing protein n=1 Tax=Nesterenkonia lacusekhoensis TaxID=150832 RepID=A0ABS4T538_9MICC|nr:DUF4190 domain-containing protein [Nesterenkonia lacusekhoensis]MBP2319547.1 hypothetical protein [Nesterenkonia lacusekhoensis]
MTEPTYPAPGYQPYGGYAPAPEPPKKGIGITAMVLGIVALVFAFIPVIGLLSLALGPVAVVLGVIALVKRRGRGQGIAGVITGAFGFIVSLAGVVLFGAFMSAMDEEEEREDVEEQVEEAAEEAGEDDAEVEEIEEEVAQEAEEPAEEPTGEWVEVASLSGTGDQRGEVFEVEGDARITYEFNESGGMAEGFGLGAIYVVSEGETLAEDGGIPEQMISGSESGETMFYQTGSFYLDVSAANYDSWTVTVEQQE